MERIVHYIHCPSYEAIRTWPPIHDVQRIHHPLADPSHCSIRYVRTPLCHHSVP